MAQQNPDTSAKHVDPYKEANLETGVSLEQKIQDLSSFMTHCKFAMMTTRDAKSGNLVSRCMALAAQVCVPLLAMEITASSLNRFLGKRRRQSPFPYQY
jgi:hypothetical protein